MSCWPRVWKDADGWLPSHLGTAVGRHGAGKELNRLNLIGGSFSQKKTFKERTAIWLEGFLLASRRVATDTVTYPFTHRLISNAFARLDEVPIDRMRESDMVLSMSWHHQLKQAIALFSCNAKSHHAASSPFLLSAFSIDLTAMSKEPAPYHSHLNVAVALKSTRHAESMIERCFTDKSEANDTRTSLIADPVLWSTVAYV